MIERRRLPDGGAVALGTGMTEVALDVVRTCRLRKVGRVTCVAICILELVVPVHMALHTGDSRVGTGELKCRGCVTECCGLPGCCAVALGTGTTKVALHVARVCRLSEIGRVTGIAVSEVQLVVAVLVALGAGH